jgi:hypothetical protein
VRAERLAHQRTADAIAVDDELPHFLDRETVGETRFPKRLDVSFATPGVVKIMAHDHVSRAESLDQQTLLERGGAHRAHRLRKAQDHDTVDAVTRQCIQLFPQTHQARGGRGAFEKFPRRGLERDHGCRQSERASLRDDRREHVLMAAMDAVVVTDRDDAAAMLRSQVMHPADEFERMAASSSVAHPIRRCHGAAPPGGAGTTTRCTRMCRTRMPRT